jgi:hypothetical protein
MFAAPFCAARKTPFAASGEHRTATPYNAAGFNRFNDGFWLHGHRLAQAFIAIMSQIIIQAAGVYLAQSCQCQ